MKLSAIIAPLLAAKADPAVILSLIEAYEAEVEAGKEKARARWRSWKERESTNVSKRLQTRTNVSKQLAGVEDRTSNSEIERKKEVREGSARAARLSPDWTLPDDWRADAIEAGLPEHRIDPEWLNMRDWSLSSPKGAKNNWRAAWRTWCRRSAADQQARAGPPKTRSVRDAALDLIHEMDMANAVSSSETEGNRPPPLKLVHASG